MGNIRDVMKLTRKHCRELRKTPADPVSGHRLRTAIELSGGTQTELARLSGLAFTYVADTVRGRHTTTSLRNAQKLARVFGCSTDDLFPPKDDQ